MATAQQDTIQAVTILFEDGTEIELAGVHVRELTIEQEALSMDDNAVLWGVDSTLVAVPSSDTFAVTMRLIVDHAKWLMLNGTSGPLPSRFVIPPPPSKK